MKLRKLAAAIGIIAAIGTTAASAAEINAVYNGEFITLDGEIINDRAMVKLDELCGIIGAEVSSENGVWSFTKGESALSYDEKTGKCTASGAEIALDVAPVMTSNEKLVPVRAFSEALGVKVGWENWYEEGGAIILHDLDAYMNKLKAEHPEVYTLLTMKIKQPEQGAGVTDMTMDIDVPAAYQNGGFKLSLKLTGTSAVHDGVEASGLTLENLDIAAPELNIALTDVTLDGIYDVKTGVMYLKTNAIEKIKEAAPSIAAELDAVSTLLPGDTWYKITIDEYLSLVGEMTGVDNSAEMKALFDNIYSEGFSFDKMLENTISSEDAVNYSYSFAGIDYTVNMLQAMVDSGALKVSADGENAGDISFVFNKEILKDVVKAMYAYSDMEWTEKEETGFEQEFADFPAVFDINCAVSVKEDTSSDVDLLMKIEMDEMKLNITAKSTFDASAETEAVTLPENAQNLLPLLKSLMSLAEAEANANAA